MKRTKRIGKHVHQFVNEEREKRNQPVLRLDSDLINAAVSHSRDMARRRFFDHQNPDGHGPNDRTSPQFTVSENISMRTDRGSDRDIARSVVDGWMDSTDHRQNVLNPEFRKCGVGTWFRDDKIFVTQIYALAKTPTATR